MLTTSKLNILIFVYKNTRVKSILFLIIKRVLSILINLVCNYIYRKMCGIERKHLCFKVELSIL
jgi:hypothetical protein